MKKIVPETTENNFSEPLHASRKIKLAYLLTFISLLFTGFYSTAQTVVINPPSPWVVPAGVTSVKVEVWGGGGGGGSTVVFGNGGGGGGGAYHSTTFSVSPGQSYTYTLGSGGTSDNDGGSTTYTGPAGTITANGGQAGRGGFFFIDGNGGAGGASGTYSGGNGANGGAGGGGAGNAAVGGNASDGTAGAGGAGFPNIVPYGGGNGGGRSANGNTPGGGGGGANPNFFGYGGNGSNGQVVITYTAGPVAPVISSFSPNPACAGNVITISGFNFLNPASVTFFNGLTVSATYVNPTTLTAALPAGASTGPATVTTAGGTSAAVVLTVQNLVTPLTVTGTGTFCGSTSVAASGGSGGNIFFQGTNAAGTSQALGSPQTVNTIGTNTYYFRELTACGWGTAYGVTVTINPLPSNFTVSVAATCNSALLTPSGALGDIFYFQGTLPGQTSTVNPGPQTVNTAGTFYYRARTAAGCWGPDVPVNVVFAVTASITNQPMSKAICVGQNTNFTVTATSGTPLSYQWYKGPTPVSNGGGISGATTPTLTFTNANAGHAGTDYYCQITDACGTIVSDYVSLAVNTVATTPTAQATVLIFPTVGVTSVLGSFDPSATATDYLVVRSNSGANLSPAPANGTNYAPGDILSGGEVEYVGPNTFFNASGLNPGQTYYFHVYAFNINTCGASPQPLYLTPALIAGVTTATNTTCPSRQPLYWAGTGSSGPVAPWYYFPNSNFNNPYNWSTKANSYTYAGASPTKCNDVVISINNDVTIIMNDNNEFYNLTFQVTGGGSNALLSSSGKNVIVYGNAVIDITGGTASTSIGIGEANTTAASTFDFRANVSIGASTVSGASTFRGNQYSKIIVRGDLTLGPSFTLATGNNTVINQTLPRTLEFDGTGLQQIIWNNNQATFPARFRDVVIGNTNNPIVRQMPGTLATPQNIIGNLTINGSSTLDLGTSQLNRHSDGGTLTMNSSSKLLMAGTSSIINGGTATLVAGSNYPSGFTSALNATSTIEYNGSHLVTQTINPAPTYKNLTLTRSTSSATANKLTAAPLTVSGTTTINNGVLLTLGAGVVNNGAVNVLPGATLAAGTHLISGIGSFTLNNGGTISTAHVDGITSSGASGTIQSSGTRTFGLSANYTYNATAAQNAGNGLPATVNDLTVNNSNGVTLNAAVTDYNVGGVLYQTAGLLDLNGKNITVNNLTRNSGTFKGSHSSGIFVNGTNIPLFFNTAATANSTLKTLELNAGKTAYLGTVLDITGGLSAGTSGWINIGSGATLTTNNLLTLRSNEFGTASVQEIPVDGSGVALGYITGDVTVERRLYNHPTIGGRKWRLLSVPTNTTQTFKSAWLANGATPGASPAGYGFWAADMRSNYSTFGFDAIGNNSSIKVLNSAPEAWDPLYSALDPIKTNKGYLVFVAGDRTISWPGWNTTTLTTKGSLYTGKQTSITIPANKFGTIGNPYASRIDMRNINTSAGHVSYYIWDPSLGGNYLLGGWNTMYWDPADLTYRNLLPSNIYPGLAGDFSNINNYIESGMAVVVKAGVTPLTVTFEENDKVSGSKLSSKGTEDNSSTNFTPGHAQRILVNLSIAGATPVLLDAAMADFDASYTNEIDDYDVSKATNINENLSWKTGNKMIVIDRRAEINNEDTLQLDLTKTKVQNYQFEVVMTNMDAPGRQGFLVDRFLKTSTALEMTGTTKVNFSIQNIAGSYAPDRFLIVFKQLAVVPVTLTSISAVRNTDKTVTVKWNVESEVNIAGYEVQRSTDGVDFISILSQAPLNNRGGRVAYPALDRSVVKGDLFYRVKAIGIDGRIQYSPIAKVADIKTPGSITVYPNPVSDGRMQLNFKDQPLGKYNLELLSASGQVVYKASISLTQNNLTEVIQLDKSVSDGNYRLRITGADGKTHTQTVLLQ